MQTAALAPIWAKLLPLCKVLPTYPLRDQKVIIGRKESQCKIVINEKRLSSQHCVLEKRDNKVYLTDMSTNGTYVNTDRVGKGNTRQMAQNDQIWLLPICKVSQEQTIGFQLILVDPNLNKKPQTPVVGSSDVRDARDVFMNSIKEQITCPYCSQIMVYPVIVQPCNHRFCGTCLTYLVNIKKGQCIICRKELLTAARDFTFKAIIDDYLRTHPEDQRPEGEEETMHNIFGFTPLNIRNIILGNQAEEQEEKKETKPNNNVQRGQIAEQPVESNMFLEQRDNQPSINIDRQQEGRIDHRGRGRGRGSHQSRQRVNRPKKSKSFISSDISASTDSNRDKSPAMKAGLTLPASHPGVVGYKRTCAECVEARNGFKCGPSQVHTTCHNCNKLFPIRNEDKVYQKCTICGSFFCNLYMPPCQKNGPTLTLLGKRGSTCEIKPLYFRNNLVQMDAFKGLLVSERMSITDMFKEMLGLCESGRFQFMFDKRLLRSAPGTERAVKLSKYSPVCDNCWRELWFQMIFMFVKEHSYLMSEAIKNRPSCYWGINCRTMEHNIEHAKKFNHMDYQTRF